MKRPFYHALAAAAYIVGIVFVIQLLTSAVLPQKTLLIPMTVLSLFVLSTAVMGYLFLYEPFRLHFDGHKREAKLFFAKTVGFFACFAALLVVALLATALL
jgi:hypothetical protein